MSDSLGGLIDKLFTIDTKMWHNQDLIYEIRRMSFNQYKEKYFGSEEGAKELWDCLKKACDLNVQRNQLIDEIDEKIVEMVKAAKDGEELDAGKFIQRKHKTY
jgi:RNAse (barnase) inhibitor barstar